VAHVVIVGGSDAGTEAALRARELDPSAEITMFVADEFVNYSVCGLPFLASGEVADWRDLAHRDLREITGRGIEVRLGHRVHAVAIDQQHVETAGPTASAKVAFDRLILATGATAVRPAVPGIELPGVFALHSMGDGIALRRWLDERSPRRVLVVGTGYIGVEIADALVRRGIEVTLVGRAPTILSSIDPDLGDLVRAELERGGVRCLTTAALRRIEPGSDGLRAAVGDGHLDVDGVVVGAGVVPDVDLARDAGIEIGATGAIQVSRQMVTSAPAVLAAGDCAETWHAMLGRPSWLPLGTTSHKQGRVAGENAVGGEATFGGSIGTQVVKVFNVAAARTGLADDDARAAGFEPIAATTVTPDHKPYYPGSSELTIRVTADRESGRLLGMQIVGHWQAEVAKRIDVAATAIQTGLSVADLLRLDLSYTPPVSAPWDPIQQAARSWLGTAG
jgi:NADPH-dependent 2,4-dienoyl-CoA reductase/sulfur reductase-like enzyme